MHLFEFHDLPWFPQFLRLGTTESLRALSELVGLSELAAPLVGEVMSRTGTTEVIDLCSGSCGPLIPLVRRLALTNPNVRAAATDLYPNRKALAGIEAASGGLIRACLTPVDARQVPEDLRGVRTLFNGFHHFRPADARAILKSAHDSGVPICIFEITNRSLGRTLGVFPGSVAIAYSAMWSARGAVPLWSFLVPLVPLTFAWDGLVSCLRSYTNHELLAMTRGLDSDYRWEAAQRQTKRGKLSVNYLIGSPS